ncbi:MAG: insulinase family protein [Lachnospiraceae bacterium]|nr:insulinase family protein [Lachnospiraceae bacterium]
MNIEKHSSYTLQEKRELKDIDSIGYVLKHNQSGARLILIENDDNNKTFSVGFRTPPADDTGVAHITEHSVLCGSKKFPVKDPFMELVKGSLNTFLNAMTYPDKTVYPVASTNDKDFKNLVDVYMDAVFHPNIYSRPEIFYQEGVTLSLDSEEAELKYNGVVYNEMKGAFSSPDDVLDRVISQSLYPDTCYGVESGGNPDFIPDLTYEKFIDFHKRYYHPSNSYIYIYGDIDMDEMLEWMDREYLSQYDYNPVDSEICLQTAFDSMVKVREEYPISESEDTSDNTYLSYNFVVGDILDKELYLAMQVLEYAIISMPGAPIKQALLDKGIGKDIQGRYNNYIRQPYFNFTAKNANEEDQDEFVKTINETLQKLVSDGVDKASLLAALNNYEFQYRENDFGSYPKGLMYSFEIFDSWLYDDTDPFRHLEQNEQFAFLRKMLETDYFEKLIQKYFIDNQHRSIVVVAPVKGLTTIKDRELKEKLEGIKSGMTPEEIKKLVERTKNLKAYQETPSTKEELDTIPVLKREDLSNEVEPFYNKETTIGDVKVVRHDIFTNGIAYMNLMFDVTDVPKELLSYLVVLKGIMGYMDTKNYSYSELSNEIGIHTGGLYQEINIYRDVQDMEKYRILFEVKGKVFFDKIEKALELVHEILFNTIVDDEKRMYEIICEGKSNLQGFFMRSADSAAVVRNLSYISKIGVANDCLKGIENYKFIENIEKNFDSVKGEIADILKKLFKHVFRKDNLIISYTANDEGYQYFENAAKKLIRQLEENNSAKMDFSSYKNDLTPMSKNEGFKTSSQVQYVTRSGNFVKKGYEYDASLKVLKMILSSEFLWKNIREQGGAYGCNCVFGKSGESYFSSYRDPNLARTNEVFEKVPEYVKKFDTDERNMTKYVIGTISGMDTPLTAAAKGNRSMSAFLTNEKIENLKKDRMQVLCTDAKKIRSLWKLVASVFEDVNLCVVGNEGKIEEDTELFKITENLFE